MASDAFLGGVLIEFGIEFPINDFGSSYRTLFLPEEFVRWIIFLWHDLSSRFLASCSD